MKQHENDLNPGPLTVSGFNEGSCFQASLPDTSRTQVKPTAKGHQRFRTHSGFKLQSMKLHENDLSQGPLTVSGLKGGSCCQASLPDTNRSQVKPSAKGHQWFRTHSGFKHHSMKQHENDLNPGTLTVSGFKGGSFYRVYLPESRRTPSQRTPKSYMGFQSQPDFDFKTLTYTMTEFLPKAKLKLIFGKSAGILHMLNLSWEIALHGIPYFIVENQNRSRTARLVTGLEKVRVGLLHGDFSRYMPCDGSPRINHSKTIKLLCRTVNPHSEAIAYLQLDFQISGKNAARSWNSGWPNQQLQSVYGQNCSFEAGFTLPKLDLEIILN